MQVGLRANLVPDVVLRRAFLKSPCPASLGSYQQVAAHRAARHGFRTLASCLMLVALIVWLLDATPPLQRIVRQYGRFNISPYFSSELMIMQCCIDADIVYIINLHP